MCSDEADVLLLCVFCVFCVYRSGMERPCCAEQRFASCFERYGRERRMGGGENKAQSKECVSTRTGASNRVVSTNTRDAGLPY